MNLLNTNIGVMVCIGKRLIAEKRVLFESAKETPVLETSKTGQ